MKNHLLFSLFLALFIFQKVYSQDGAPKLTSQTPVSPNSASLGKYGEIPVGLYTGVPNINIPFYEVSSGSLKLPISISYHAGGVKVEEIASWIGLGWSLNAGGVVGRQLRGLPDESGGGYLNTWQKINQFLNNEMTAAQKQEYLMDVNNGILDSQQDVFFYNVGGESGKFILDPSGVGVPITASKSKIEFGTFLGIEKSWKITSTNGDVYFFTNQETSSSISMVVGGGSSTSIASINSWYITKIQNSNASNEISFEYEPTNYQFKTLGAQTNYFYQRGTIAGTSRSSSTSYSYNTINGLRLSKIKFTNGEINLIKKSQQRSDLPGDYALDALVISSDNMNFYKRVNFYQSYTTSDEPPSYEDVSERKRLFLDSIATVDVSGIKAESYQFGYNKNILLPSRSSYNQDHWGYYNGANNGFSFTPTTTIDYSGQPFIIESADRGANQNYSQAGILNTIVYPTKGKTVFEYENNTASNAPPSLDVVTSYENAKILADGFTTHYEQVFSITEGFGTLNGVNAVVSINRDGCPPYASSGCPVTLLYFPDGHVVNISTNGNIYLPIGEYRLVADLSNLSGGNMINDYFVRFTWPKGSLASQRYNMIVGGLRIKKISNYDSNALLVGTKSYNYLLPNEINKSSGYLLSFPSYVGSIVDYGIIKVKDQDFIVSADYLTISSASNLPLISTQNSSVGYSYVEELLGTNGNGGKNINEFSFATDLYFDDFPFAPAISREWRRGLGIKSEILKYNAINANFETIETKISDYQDHPGSSYPGLKVGQRVFGQLSGTVPVNSIYEVANFLTVTGWSPLDSDTTYKYDKMNHIASKVVNSYQYNTSNLLPKIVTAINSSGSTKLINYYYPGDMVTNGQDPDGVYQGMVAKNIISPVVEQKQTVNNKIIGQRTNYIQPYSGLFTPGTVAVKNVLSGLDELRLRYNRYDTRGNILSAMQEDGVKINYLYSYKNQYPICEIKNADYATIESILGGTTAVSSFATASPTDAEVNALINTLRNSPLLKDTQITSYTYKPLVGMTSSTDAKGMTTYYEYDAFQRLKAVKDQNGNILKQTDYHYKN